MRYESSGAKPKNDMYTLPNVNIRRYNSFGFAPIAIPEANGSHTGVSVEYGLKVYTIWEIYY